MSSLLLVLFLLLGNTDGASSRRALCTKDQDIYLAKLSSAFTQIDEEDNKEIREYCKQKHEIDDNHVPTVVALPTGCIGHLCVIEASCSAALITRLHAITSADCLKTIAIENRTIRIVFAHGNKSAFYLSSTNRRLMGAFTTPYLRTGFENIKVPWHNIALIELEKRLPDHFRPVCLASRNSELPPKTLTLVLTKKTRRGEEELTRKNLKTWSDTCSEKAEHCSAVYVKANTTVDLPISGAMALNANGELFGLLTNETNPKNRFKMVVRVAYFASFICVHTGLCENGETARQFQLFPIYMRNGVSEQTIINELKKMNETSPLKWKDMHKARVELIERLAHRPGRQNILTKAEYAEVKEICGKAKPSNRQIQGVKLNEIFKLEEQRWVALIAMKASETSKPTVVCSGSFISKRHVFTESHCMEASKKYVVLYGSIDLTNLDSFEQVPVKSIMMTHHNDERREVDFDMAILELSQSIEPSAKIGVLCIPDYKQFHSADFEETSRFYTASKNETHLSEFSYTSSTVGVRSPFGWTLNLPYAPLSTDNGGPIVRKRRSDGRYSLFGFHFRSIAPGNKDMYNYVRVNEVLREICEMSGVCEAPRNKATSDPLMPMILDGQTICHGY